MSCKITARIETLTARIAADTKTVEELKAQLAAAALVADVAAGFTVSFKVGRAETRRELTGVVLGRGEIKGVDCVRVQTGEGFELEVHTVKVTELLTIAAPEREPSAIAVAMGTAAAGTSEADPLASVLG